METSPHPLLMLDKKVLALITARGGSKGLPRKNVLEAGGKPLIAWTIEAALNSRSVSQVILSSDDDEIIDIAQRWGCSVPFRRPSHLATDTATSIDVVMHALDEVTGFDYVILLQPTSPLRTSVDIDAAFARLESEAAQSCVSVSQAGQSPYWMYNLDDRGRLRSLFPSSAIIERRQDLPAVYSLNGAIYIARIDWLRKTKTFVTTESVAYVMNQRNSLDIDTLDDFEALRSRIDELPL